MLGLRMKDLRNFSERSLSNLKPPYEGSYRNRYEALISIADDDDTVQSIGQENYKYRLLRLRLAMTTLM